MKENDIETPKWKGKHYAYFQNRECEFFPCHKGLDVDQFNCLFCYCPLYVLGKDCGGNPQYTEKGIKDCTQCTLPHRPDNYGYVTGQFQKIVGTMTKNLRTEVGKESKMEPVKRLKRELRAQGTVIGLYKDTVEVNGQIAEWDFIHHDGAAAVVAEKEKGKLMMVRQYRNALDRFTLELPAGKLDAPNEPTLECARRELEEETGYKSDDFEYLMTLNTTVAFCNEKIDVYLAKNLQESKQHLDPEEEINVEVWDVEDLKELIYTGKMTDAKTVAGIMAYVAKYM